jgi:hypothetical protein
MILDPSQHPEKDESERCQFCPYRGKLTQEHIWPWRLRNHFPQLRTAAYTKGGFTAGRVAPDTEWTGRPFASTASIDCHPCNHRRLERIEAEAIPLFVAMARGALPKSGILPNNQRKLAAFALRMVAVGQYTDANTRPVPRAHREHLAQNASPPSRVEVWAFCCEHGEVGIDTIELLGSSQRFAGMGEGIPHRANSYRGLLRFGRIVLELAARSDGGTVPVIPPDSRAFLRLWPLDLQRIGVWPPDRMITEEEFRRRVDSFGQAATLWPRPI